MLLRWAARPGVLECCHQCHFVLTPSFITGPTTGTHCLWVSECKPCILGIGAGWPLGLLSISRCRNLHAIPGAFIGLMHTVYLSHSGMTIVIHCIQDMGEAGAREEVAQV